jgi:hypothetical protein
MRSYFLCACVLGAICAASGQTAAKQGQTKQAPDPRSIVLVGDRFKPLKYDDMTPEQKMMIDHLAAGPRRGAGGPFNVLLRSPEVGDLAAEFGEAMRFRAALPKDIAETVIIMTGRYWMAQFEWNAHKAAALQNGVKPEIVDAIATGGRPTGMPPQREAAYNFIDELLNHASGHRRDFQGRQRHIWREGRGRYDRVERMVLHGLDDAGCGPLSFAGGRTAGAEAA